MSVVFETKITEEYDIFNSRELELPITTVSDVFIVIIFVSKIPPISRISIIHFIDTTENKKLEILINLNV